MAIALVGWRAALVAGGAALLMGASAAAQFADADAQFAEALRIRETGDVRALQLAEAAALNGHARAAVLAGQMLETGYGGAQDAARAVEYYRLAAADGDVDAVFRLGLMALDGRGGLSAGQAAGFFQTAAESGMNEARYELAKLHLDGASYHHNVERGLSLLRLAAIDGYEPAHLLLGLSLAEHATTGSEFDEAAHWLGSAAEGGDAEAAYAAGLAFIQRGESAAAARLFAVAAARGHLEAAAELGWIYYRDGSSAWRSCEAAGGSSTVAACRAEIDGEQWREGVDWLRRAAIGGDPIGRYRYAWALAEGADGVLERDLESAYRWLLLAEAAGVADFGAGGDAAKIKNWLENELGPEFVARVNSSPLFFDNG